MVDLHSHTNKSDGSLAPAELVDLACRKGLRALAVTDHDTIEGYDEAASYAGGKGLDLICGVELSSKFHGRSIHVLGYFLSAVPGAAFRHHLDCLQISRRERNGRLAARLRSLGLQVEREEAEQLGRSQTGRPHFARLLVQKGYVRDMREAFDRYLDEAAPGYVERRDPTLDNAVRWIHEDGGLASWAHPGRFIEASGLPAETLFGEIAGRGMDAIEVFHSDHTAEQQAGYRGLATRIGLAVTGGSDYHGDRKPQIELGSLQLPDSLLEQLRNSRPRAGAGTANTAK